MRTVLPVLLLLTPVLHAEATLPAPTQRKLSAVSLLPDGSQLHGVMFPRYDENRRLVGVLKAAAMTLVNDQTIAGETITIEFYNPDGTQRGRADLANAVFNQEKGTLKAMEPVTIQTAQMNATGTGLIYSHEQSKGFLLGPVTTWIKNPPQTTMNSHLITPGAAALLGLSLIAHPVTAAPPTPLSPDQITALQSAAAPLAPTAASALKTARETFTADSIDSAAASAAAETFLTQADLPVPASEAEPETKPLDVQPGPRDTVISSDGGMYFDADKGIFVYMKNVRVKDPRFELKGANELKVFIGKKPANPTGLKPEEKDKTGLGLGAKFGDVERIIATGAVHIIQKEVEAGKQPVEASGAVFTYHLKTGEIVINGGYPWVKQGVNFMRAKQPNLILRIQENGSFITEGNWEMGGNLDAKP